MNFNNQWSVLLTSGIFMIISRPLFIMILTLILAPVMLEQGLGYKTRSDLEEPTITFLVQDNIRSVDVSPGSSGEVDFTLVVTCVIGEDAPTGAKAEVDLRTRAWWWNVTTIPLMVFTKDRTRIEVEIIVTAPTNSSADTIVDLEIWGSWRYVNTTQWGSITRTTVGRISVDPFFDLFLGSNNPKKFADIGDWSEFSFNITNRANRDLNLTIRIEKDNSHLIVIFNDTKLEMMKGETRTLTFKVRQEPSQSRGNTIHVKAVVEEDPDNGEWDLPLLFYTEPTVSTFFYERNFMRLLLIILVIACVSAGLFLWERHRKVKDCYHDEEEPERTVKNSRPIDVPGKR